MNYLNDTMKDLLPESLLNNDNTLLNNFTLEPQKSVSLKRKNLLSLRKQPQQSVDESDSDTDCSIINSPIQTGCKRNKFSTPNKRHKKTKIFNLTFNESLLSLKDHANLFSQDNDCPLQDTFPSPLSSLSDQEDLCKDEENKNYLNTSTKSPKANIPLTVYEMDTNKENLELYNSTQFLKQIDKVVTVSNGSSIKCNKLSIKSKSNVACDNEFVSDDDLDIFYNEICELKTRSELVTDANLEKCNELDRPSTSKGLTGLSHLDDIFQTRNTFKEPAIPKDKSKNINKICTFSNKCESSRIMEQTKEAIFTNIKTDVSSITDCDKNPKDAFEFSQFYSTQIMKQIDSIISQDKYSDGSDISKNKRAITQGIDQSNYKADMQALFENVENSICAFGDSNSETPTKKNVKDFLEKSLRSPQIIKQAIQKAEECLKGTSAEVWKDDTLLADALINMSMEGQDFGNLIKKALMNNVNKCISPPKIINETICEDNVVFRNYGSFYGLPDKVKQLIKTYKGIDTLYDWQNECLNLPAVNSRKNLIYALPTSGGKTLVAEILLLREVLCRRKNVIFVLPYVAIVQEKVWSLSPFAVALEFLIEEYAAGRGNYPPRKRRKKNSVYIATIEKALGLVNSLIENDRLSEIGLIVIDELHLVGDSSRGPNLEELLTKILVAKRDIQIIGMSATIGNLKDIYTFLKADVFVNDFRPVELIEYIKCGEEIAKVDVKTEDIFIFERKVDYKYPESLLKIDPDHLGGLVMEVIPKDSCLVFCRSKKNCENVAILLSKVVFGKLKQHRIEEKRHILNALKEESGNLCSILKTSIVYGIAYHHSGLTSEERKIIEEGFRSGVISVICCTSTLAAGVNLPAKRVIVRNPYIGRDFINLSRYKQMAGRAGRAGFSEMGESIIICSPNELSEVRKLFLSPMDVAVSGMHENETRGLRQFLLSCISLGLANTKSKLQEVASCTLLAVQKDRLNVDVKQLVKVAIRDLFKMGALQIQGNEAEVVTKPNNISVTLDTTAPATQHVPEVVPSTSKTIVRVTNDSVLVISKMGSAAIRGGLDLIKAHMLYEDLLEAQFRLVLLSGLHLMYLVTPYDLSEQINPSLTTYYNLYSRLTNRELQTAKVIGINEAVASKMLTNKKITEVPLRVLNRFYVTLMLYDLWNEMTVYDVAAKYDINRGLIQNLMTSAATFASNVYHFCEEFQEFWAFSLLLKGMSDRLSHCCVKELVPLMKLPSVKQNRARQLFQAGYKTLQSVAKANPDDLINSIEYMSMKLANQLIAAAKLILLERVENLREEAEDVLDGIVF